MHIGSYFIDNFDNTKTVCIFLLYNRNNIILVVHIIVMYFKKSTQQVGNIIYLRII